MCGMHRTTVSPSSSSTRRSTPCVAGCDGPRLMSMCSPCSSGSSSSMGGASSVLTFPPWSDTSARRTGRPWASVEVVPRATSTVRFVVAIASLPRRLAALEAAAHVVRKVRERLGHRELLHGVARFRVGGEHLPELLGAAEAAAQREVLPQREPLAIPLPHQEAAQVGMPEEADAEHVEALALEPIRAPVDR